MSRQAKYRQPVFAEKTGDFLYWHYWGWMNKGEFIGPLSMGHNVKDEMGLQYTGLKDKNGTEIYELMEIDGEFRVIYDLCFYVLQDISTGDIIGLLDNSMVRAHEREITGEYSPVQKD